MALVPDSIHPLQAEAPAAEPYSVEHLAERGRFRVVVDGQASELDYRIGTNVMSITHTGVPARLEGRGIAAALTRAALAHARANGWKVRPMCSYAASYMQRHPETADLRA